jgi:hypothetical protein
LLLLTATLVPLKIADVDYVNVGYSKGDAVVAE